MTHHRTIWLTSEGALRCSVAVALVALMTTSCCSLTALRYKRRATALLLDAREILITPEDDSFHTVFRCSDAELIDLIVSQTSAYAPCRRPVRCRCLPVELQIVTSHGTVECELSRGEFFLSTEGQSGAGWVPRTYADPETGAQLFSLLSEVTWESADSPPGTRFVLPGDDEANLFGRPIAFTVVKCPQANTP